MGRRGMTLAELVVVASLLLALLAVSVSVLVPGMRAWLRSERRSEAQQSVLVVTTLLLEEIRHAHGGGVAVKAKQEVDPDDGGSVRRDRVCMLSARDRDGQLHSDDWGETIWQTRVLIYHAGASRQVRLRRMRLSPPTAYPEPLLLEEFDGEPADRVVARGVRSLALSYDGYGNLAIDVEARIDGQKSSLRTTGTILLAEVYRGKGPPAPSPPP